MISRHPTPLSAVCLCLLLTASVAARQFAPSDYTYLDDTVSGEVDVHVMFRVPQTASADAATRVVFSQADDNNYLYVDCDADGMSLCEVRDGLEEVLDEAGWDTVPEPGEHEITVKRRSWAIRVLFDGKAMLMAYDAFSPGERIATAVHGSEIEDVFAQPIGEMYFADDFARPPGEPDPWKAASGRWVTSLPESRNKRAEAAKSANPFSYRATGPTALTVAGSGFWDGYELRAAVKAGEPGQVGLAFYVQDASNYYLFRVQASAKGADGVSPAALLKVEDGNATIVAEAAHAVQSGKWYELAARAHDGRIEALVDDKVVCQARDDTFNEGRIGLYTHGCPKAYFDDVRLERYRFFEDNYDPDGKMPVEQVAGTWLLQGEQLEGRPDGDLKMAVGLSGCPQWRDYTFAADVTPDSATSVGLYFACTSQNDYYLFRWGPNHDDRSRHEQQLWRVQDGRGEVVGSRPASFSSGGTYAVRVTADRAYYCVTVDGERVLQAAAPGTDSTGRIGYYVEGASGSSAAFDNMRVSFCDQPVEPVSIADQFAKEDTMADWARPLASWQSLGKRTYAYSLPAWGDFCLRLRLKYFVGRTGAISLRLSQTAKGLAEAPDIFLVSSAKGGKTLTFSSPHSPQKAPQVQKSCEQREPMLELERRGRLLVASLDGEAVAWAPAQDGVAAPFVALKLGGVGINLNDVDLTSPQIIDASFSGAPTQWSAQNGVWEISDRWNCQPQWSWFCGRSSLTPLLWSKKAFSGDMVFEFWAAMMMDLPKGYSHPSDINGIICGDGENLCSGYAFVYAGDRNQRGKIIRQGNTVAETTAFRFLNPTPSGNLADFHRHWFHCRVERTGNKLTYSVDGKQALAYEDPSPLSGGHVGLWTHQGNGLLVARVRIAAQHIQ